MVYTKDIEVTPREIREAWATIQTGANPFSEKQSGSATVYRLPQYRSEETNDWIGASGAEIQRRLEHGYEVEDKDVDLNGHAPFEMPRVELDEEQGDLLVDQVLGGEDFYRAMWQEHEAPRSLTIRACIGMHADASAKVLGAYMEWILKVADGLHRKGVTPSIELWVGTKGGFARSKDTLRVRIPLVQAGEVVDVTSWRAYLTPGAFRSLGFVAIALAADKAKRTLTFGMGSPTNTGWKVTFEDDVLDIECPGGDTTFPESLMDLKLEEAGI